MQSQQLARFCDAQDDRPAVAPSRGQLHLPRTHAALMTPQETGDRRRYPRVKAQIPVELLPSGTTMPMRTATEEISLCGCYIPSMFTLEVGKTLHVILSLDEERIPASAVVGQISEYRQWYRFHRHGPERSNEAPQLHRSASASC
jgi:hypothetical protein